MIEKYIRMKTTIIKVIYMVQFDLKLVNTNWDGNDNTAIVINKNILTNK